VTGKTGRQLPVAELGLARLARVFLPNVSEG
jgi:hypothetical protein